MGPRAKAIGVGPGLRLGVGPGLRLGVGPGLGG